jgi:hypothetical protein
MQGNSQLSRFQIKHLTLACCILLNGLVTTTYAVFAQTVTPQQLQSLAPEEQDLQGFTHTRPAGEIPLPDAYSSVEHQWYKPVSKAEIIENEYTTGHNENEWHPGWAELPDIRGQMSQIVSSFYSNDGVYHLTITMNICDTPDTARTELAQFLLGCSARFQKGTFSSIISIGDESWFNPNGYSTLVGRAGRVMFLIDGQRSWLASHEGTYPSFPEAAVENVAYQSLLRASQQTALTGVSAQNAHLTVNGHTLPKNALKVAGRVYVPVQEFAKAMGLTSHWNNKTGALALTGANRKPITLTAGNTAATIGGAKAAALTVPVLKDGGQPVMTLEDLLRLTGGRITSQAGNTVQVKG